MIETVNEDKDRISLAWIKFSFIWISEILSDRVTDITSSHEGPGKMLNLRGNVKFIWADSLLLNRDPNSLVVAPLVVEIKINWSIN